MLLCIALTAGEWGFEAVCSGYQMATLKGSERENIKGPGLQIIVWAVISHCLLSGISLVFFFFFLLVFASSSHAHLYSLSNTRTLWLDDIYLIPNSISICWTYICLNVVCICLSVFMHMGLYMCQSVCPRKEMSLRLHVVANVCQLNWVSWKIRESLYLQGWRRVHETAHFQWSEKQPELYKSRLW